MRCAFILLLVLSTAHARCFEWTPLPPFPGTPRDDASAFTISTTIYVGTGREVSFALTNDWYAFDMVDQTWTAIASLPASGRQYCAAFSDGTYGYLFGGVDDSGPLNELWRYDPVLDEWEEMSPLPAAGRYATVAFDNGMVCTGLFGGGIPTNECWRYDVATDSWNTRASVPGPARHRASGSGGLVRVVGGANMSGEALADGYIYDPMADAWSPITAIPAGRIGADAVGDIDLGTTYLVGGASSSTEFHADTWSLTDGEWTALPSFSGGPRRGGVMAFGTSSGVNDRTIYYGTGSDDVQRYADWWSYTTLFDGIPEGDRMELTVSPNPSNGEVRVEGCCERGPLRFLVRDHTGRILLTGNVDRSGMIDLTTLSTGDYILHLTNGTQAYQARSSILRP